MAENLLKVVPHNSAVAATCNAVLKNAEEMIATKKTLLDVTMNNNFTVPLNTYQGQYREIAVCLSLLDCDVVGAYQRTPQTRTRNVQVHGTAGQVSKNQRRSIHGF